MKLASHAISDNLIGGRSEPVVLDIPAFELYMPCGRLCYAYINIEESFSRALIGVVVHLNGSTPSSTSTLQTACLGHVLSLDGGGVDTSLRGFSFDFGRGPSPGKASLCDLSALYEGVDLASALAVAVRQRCRRRVLVGPEKGGQRRLLVLPCGCGRHGLAFFHGLVTSEESEKCHSSHSCAIGCACSRAGQARLVLCSTYL